MTRVNLVPPEELMDQHLFAEFRELKMIPKSLNRSLIARGPQGVLDIIPAEFTLNKGHVTFFYDKGLYLWRRYLALRDELSKRGINYNPEAQLDPDRIFPGLPASFQNDYTPTPEALALVRERIALRRAERPGWYRYHGQVGLEEFI